MENRYLRRLADDGLDAARAMVEQDARDITDACNPVAVAGALHDMLVFYGRTETYNREALAAKPAVQLALTQLTWLLAGQNVAPDSAWEWLGPSSAAS
jgi:hypothetical protein